MVDDRLYRLVGGVGMLCFGTLTFLLAVFILDSDLTTIAAVFLFVTMAVFDGLIGIWILRQVPPLEYTSRTPILPWIVGVGVVVSVAALFVLP